MRYQVQNPTKFKFVYKYRAKCDSTVNVTNHAQHGVSGNLEMCSKHLLHSANSGSLGFNRKCRRGGGEGCQFASEFPKTGNERHCIAKQEQ